MLTRFLMTFTALILTSLACAQERDVTTIRLGQKVAVQLPTDFLANATINRFFNPDSLFIKRTDGSYISITPLNREILALSDDFNLSDYPKYILALADEEAGSEIKSTDLENLKQARSVWQSEQHDQPVDVSFHEQNTGMVYARCGSTLCYNFFVEHAQNDEIIMIEVPRIDNEVLLGMLGGGQKQSQQETDSLPLSF